jgi:UDP-N-acetylenolpyruvoylglucosamine reductase
LAKPATPDELIATLKICQNLGVRYVIVGRGTKILPPDEIINAVVIIFKAAYWNTLKWIDDNTLYCTNGVQISAFCNSVKKKHFTGVEKLLYIPGNIGGAICMNAGSHGQTISGHLVHVEMLDSEGNVHTIEKDKLRFTYRQASIPKDYIVLGATFKFDKQASDEYFELASEEFLNWRKSHQPKGINFGSVFKNGDDFCAGALIDQAGLKNKKIGNASISETHANFILNHNNASSKDIEQLIDLARYSVCLKFGKFLQTEVKFLRA